MIHVCDSPAAASKNRLLELLFFGRVNPPPPHFFVPAHFGWQVRDSVERIRRNGYLFLPLMSSLSLCSFDRYKHLVYPPTFSMPRLIFKKSTLLSLLVFCFIELPVSKWNIVQRTRKFFDKSIRKSEKSSQVWFLSRNQIRRSQCLFNFRQTRSENIAADWISFLDWTGNFITLNFLTNWFPKQITSLLWESLSSWVRVYCLPSQTVW